MENPSSIDQKIDKYHSVHPGAFAEPPLPTDWDSDWVGVTLSDPQDPSLDIVEDAFAIPGEMTTSSNQFMTEATAPAGLSEAPSFEAPFPGAPVKVPSSPRPPADAYAFYLPFHLFRNRGWGIYLIANRVDELVDDFYEETHDDLTRQECAQATRLYLYEHEYFHHKAEAFASSLEASHREKIYWTWLPKRTVH